MAENLCYVFTMYDVPNRLTYLSQITLTFVVCTLLAGCSLQEKKKEEALLHLQLGTSMLAKGHFPQALRELLTAEKLDQNNEIIQNNLGLAYFLRDRFEDAEKHLRSALSIKPTYTEARNNLGRTLIELGRNDEAIEQLEMVVADLTYDEPAKAWINMGMANFNLSKFKKARDCFAEAIKLNREHCLAQTYFGRTHLELQEFSQAARILDNAIVICRASKFEDPQYYSGITYYKMGKNSQAIARLEEVMKLYPDSKFSKKAESLLEIINK